ncbi:hypothetical protein SDC9_131567 [bioreactor metagenome]|uniref:Uncharacterized protein n=1 Tax=bioreactor metagenome TaxID=1076179 RepID=A0A645D5K2_9ZZZZ
MVGGADGRKVGILPDLYGVAPGVKRAEQREEEPHKETEAGAGEHRNLRDALRDRDAERVHPRSAETYLRGAVSDHYRHYRVIAERDHHRHDDEDKGDRLLSHPEDRASEREKKEKHGDYQRVHPLCLLYHALHPRFDRAGTKHDAESSPDDEDEGYDAYRRAPLVAGYEALKGVIEYARLAVRFKKSDAFNDRLALLVELIPERLRHEHVAALFGAAHSVLDLVRLKLSHRYGPCQKRGEKNDEKDDDVGIRYPPGSVLCHDVIPPL